MIITEKLFQNSNFFILELKIIDIKIFQYYMNFKTNSNSKPLSQEKVGYFVQRPLSFVVYIVFLR